MRKFYEAKNTRRFVCFAELKKLSLHSAEREDDFTENFVEHLSESGVDRGETAEDSFVTGEMFEAGARIRVVADREQEEKNRQRSKHNL
jgi:hypothetical protein